MTFGTLSIGQTNEFTVAYATDVANIRNSWLPHGMFELRACSPKLFVVDVTTGGYREFERNMVLKSREFVADFCCIVARTHTQPDAPLRPGGALSLPGAYPVSYVLSLHCSPFSSLSQYDTLLCGVQVVSAVHVRSIAWYFPLSCLTSFLRPSIGILQDISLGSHFFMIAFIVGV